MKKIITKMGPGGPQSRQRWGRFRGETKEFRMGPNGPKAHYAHIVQNRLSLSRIQKRKRKVAVELDVFYGRVSASELCRPHQPPRVDPLLTHKAPYKNLEIVCPSSIPINFVSIKYITHSLTHMGMVLTFCAM